jgi:hypothetical protein
LPCPPERSELQPGNAKAPIKAARGTPESHLRRDIAVLLL